MNQRRNNAVISAECTGETGTSFALGPNSHKAVEGRSTYGGI